MKGLKEGTWIGYYDNGNTRYTGDYSEGNKSGLWKFYSRDGSVENTESYISGQLDGEAKSYNEDHILLSVSTYRTGKLIRVVYYDRNGKITGESGDDSGNFDLKGYYIDGKLNYTGAVKDGNYDGQFVYYFHNGNEILDGKTKISPEA